MNQRFLRCLGSALLLVLAACEGLGTPPEATTPSLAVFEAEAAPLTGEGPAVRITVPSQNASIDLAGPGPTVVTVRYEMLPAPGDATGGVRYVFDNGEPALVEALTGSFSLTVGVGLHSLTLLVTDDEGAPLDAPAARATHVFKVTAPCTTVADCVDSNPCSADFCFVVGLDRRCQYGIDPGHPSCCLNRYDCPAGEMCTDIFPLGEPDGYGECVECDGTPSNCPARACNDARCHDLSFTCVYDRRADGCCIPGEDECLREPCEGCVSEDGFEGSCGPVGEPGTCCFQSEGAAGAPVYGCESDDRCAVAECAGNTCRFGNIYEGCCTEDADCDDPLELNACTADVGVCEDDGGDPATGRCAYPRVVPDCCAIDGDCQDRYPGEVGRCARPAPDAPGTCVYEDNPQYCTWDGPGVVLTELLVDSDVGYLGDWFELYNATGEEVDLLGWRIENGAVPGDALFVVGDAPVLVPPGGYFVIGHSDDPAQNGGVDIDYAVFGLALSTASGAVRLVDREGRETDFVFWDERFPMEPARAMGRTSPFRAPDSPEAWRASSALYGPGGRGTPGRANLEIYDAAWAPPVCDDGDPCTLDLCHGTIANVCAHRRVPDCCASAGDRACDDEDLCTIDTCDVGAFTCSHILDLGVCCETDGQCPPGPPGLPLEEEVLYSICAVPRCVNRRCLYERNPLRPGCCVSANHGDLGCHDANPCSPNVCLAGAGTTEFGTLYNACVFPYDGDGDGLNECCDTNADCDDGDPTTAERCRLDVGGTRSHTCERGADLDYCGPEAATHDCDDSNPCTADTCCDDIDEPLAGCEGAFRCLHVAAPNCCADDEHCSDGDLCTDDVCCRGVGDPVAACGAAGDCVHEPRPTCCHENADCQPGKPPAAACLVSRCLGGRCTYGPDLIAPDCCVTGADCEDGDRCTLEACVDGACRSEGTLSPPHCCYERSDCPRDNDSCFTWTCWQQECVQFPVYDCCSLADEGSSAVCDDDDRCTADLCHDGRCHHARESEPPRCCVVTADCPPSGSACAAVACDGASGYCRAATVVGCVAPLPFREPFLLRAAYVDQVSLPTLGWSQTGGGATWTLASSRGVGPGRAARFDPARATAGNDYCLVSPAIRTAGTTEATLQWRAAFEDGAPLADGVVVRVVVGSSGDPTDWARVWDADAAAAGPDALGRWTAPIPGAALGSLSTKVAFCARVLPGSAGALPGWAVQDVVLAAGTPPEWSGVPDEPVAAYSGNVRWVRLAVVDPGPRPDGAVGRPDLIVGPAGAPPFIDTRVVPDTDGSAWTVWVSLRPSDLDVVRHAPAILVVGDGALRTPITLPIDVRSAFCGTSADCDDGDPCTIGACRDDSRCYVRQPLGCRP